MAPHPQWSDDQLDEMLKRMSDGETLTSIASDARMPSVASMIRWEEDQDTDLGASITRARAQGYLSRAEKIVESVKLAEDASLARLEFDAERWFLGKMAPKKFGDSATLKHAGPDGEKLEMGDVERSTRLAAIFKQIDERSSSAD